MKPVFSMQSLNCFMPSPVVPLMPSDNWDALLGFKSECVDIVILHHIYTLISTLNWLCFIGTQLVVSFVNNNFYWKSPKCQVTRHQVNIMGASICCRCLYEFHQIFTKANIQMARDRRRCLESINYLKPVLWTSTRSSVFINICQTHTLGSQFCNRLNKTMRWRRLTVRLIVKCMPQWYAENV